jgi:hypothetical protein
LSESEPIICARCDGFHGRSTHPTALETDLAVIKADLTSVKWMRSSVMTGVVSVIVGVLSLVLKAFV